MKGSRKSSGKKPRRRKRPTGAAKRSRKESQKKIARREKASRLRERQVKGMELYRILGKSLFKKIAKANKSEDLSVSVVEDVVSKHLTARFLFHKEFEPVFQAELKHSPKRHKRQWILEGEFDVSAFIFELKGLSPHKRFMLDNLTSLKPSPRVNAQMESLFQKIAPSQRELAREVLSKNVPEIKYSFDIRGDTDSLKQFKLALNTGIKLLKSAAGVK
jgi:hypothetical protein